MTTPLVYMQLATRVYAASDNNMIDLPLGWSEDWLRDQSSGFSAGTYVNDKTKEIVIAYAGTNQWQDVLNWPAITGQPAPQIFQAMTYYMNFYTQFKATHPDDYMDYSISFTGHSLGGGLASLMAVFFDEQATVFDEIPVQLAALNPVVILTAVGIMTAAGYSDEKFTDYVESGGLLALTREANVTQYSIEDEVAGTIRTSANTLVGNDTTPISLGNSTAGRIERHSMALMLAVWASPSFLSACQKLPDLVTQLLDKNLFAADENKADKDDLLRKLLQNQTGEDGMLTRFAADMLNIAQDSGLSLSDNNIAKGLTAFAMQYYYTKPDAANAGSYFFDTVSGGIHFDRRDVAATLEGENGAKGYSYFLNYLNSLPETDMDYAVIQVVKQKMSNLLDWYIQAGTSPMNATAGNNPAFMLGGSGNDTLTGGSADDVLMGGQGIDYLNGGGGVDIMLGGAGNDTYYVDKAGDYAYESEYEGKDTVKSTITYTLPDYVENLTLEGTASINGVGNELNNVIIGNSGNNTIYGRVGNDTIQGGNGVNTLFGEAGDDQIFGGKDSDAIDGGTGDDIISPGGGVNKLSDQSGFDQYMLSRSGRNTIIDDDGDGCIYLDGVRLTGSKQTAPCEYFDGENTYIWSGVNGTNLIINRSIIVKNFYNNTSDLGIYLYKKEDDDADGGGGSGGGNGSGSGGSGGGSGYGASGGAPGFGGANSATVPCDPLLIDLNGDGIQTVASTQGIFFDYDANGFAERMGWASAEDGLLVLDRNQDGIINDGSELFGDQTILSTGKKAANGFQALADLDSNTDGKIDINDAAYTQLRIWQDIDGDGYSQTNELFTLDELGIKSISLASTATNITDASGNTQTLLGSFEKTDGVLSIGV